MLVYVVPLFKGADADNDDASAEKTFAAHAAEVPGNWFNTNPVNCLRSKHIYNHSPPCLYVEPGKEHLLQVNKKIGCYFDGEASGKVDSEGTPSGVKSPAKTLK